MQQGIEGAEVALVADQEYFTTVTRLIEGSRKRCLCSMFIADLRSVKDKKVLVDRLLLQLQAAVWRGADTRLLLGGSRDNFEIARVVLTTKLRADRLAIPSRLMAARNVRGTHMKLIVADNRVLTGSHNWSFGAFTDQTQDSVLLESSALAARLAAFFEDQWVRAEGVQHV
jgi:phosphatidylserine/phosphatidylglycerophosphate/cardiolipin synthase-like enzyme